jgi:GAF domain-containing protein
MPADIVAVYVYSPDQDHLVASLVVGDHADAIIGATIPSGQRLTGWVAANRQTIVNSDAALDLGNLTLQLDPTPHACLSVPMCAGNQLVGVLTVYSTRRQPFTDDHVPILEAIAARFARLLRAKPNAARIAPAVAAADYAPAGRVH